jgi:archaellum biogenesis ATPase FlaH
VPKELRPRLLPYRIENAGARKIIIKLSCGKLEFLGKGQQFVGFGRHPSGIDYEWQGQPLDEIEIDELPVVDAAGISALAAWAEERWPAPEKAKPNGSGRANGGKADFRNTTIKGDVEAALLRLKCDYAHEMMTRLGYAYRSGGGSYTTFLKWASDHPGYKKFPEDEADKWVWEQWQSFADAHSITVATLFEEVFRLHPGWKKPSERGNGSASAGGGPVDEDEWESEDEKDADIMDCYDTRRTEFPPLEFAAAPYILAGQLTLISANPKMGKSFLALQIALAIATGTSAFEGYPVCKQGAVLYLALEDNQRRMKSRLNKLMRFRRLERGKLMSKYTAERAHEGGFEMLKRWIKRTPDARLIIIDVLSLFRRPRSHREEPYAADLEAMTELRALANNHDVAIIAIMHNRKSQADSDPFESVSGTMGQTAGAETVLVVQRDRRGGVTLYGRGRDFEVEV